MFKKNTAAVGFGIGHFINASTGAAVTTGTPTCKRTIDGTGGACANAASYNSDGAVWEIDLDAADMNGDVIILSFTLTDCLPISYTIHTVTGVPDGSGHYPSDIIEAAGVAWASGAITAAVIADNAIDAATFAADVDAEIATMVWNAKTSAYGNSGDFGTVVKDWLDGGRLDAILDELTSQGDTNETKLDTIITDTNELQTDWTNGGRLDAILDELTTQGDTNEAAIDSVLSTASDTYLTVASSGAVVSAASVRNAIGMAAADLDDQLAAIVEDTGTTIPATITTIDTLLDRMAPALIGTVTGAGTGTEVFVYGGVTATYTVDEDGNRSEVAFS